MIFENLRLSQPNGVAYENLQLILVFLLVDWKLYGVMYFRIHFYKNPTVNIPKITLFSAIWTICFIASKT